jgi:caspase domain-containing protein
MSGKYALIIGNTEYTDPGLAQLTAPGKDAEDFARVLRDQDICAFDEVNIIFNQPSSSVIEEIDKFFDQKKPDDLLVLYFSGHGVRDELGVLYLAVKNTNRFRLRSTSVKSDFVKEAMDQSRSRRQVLILDCCNSGAFAQGTKAATGVSIGIASAFEAGYGRIILTASDTTQFAWEGDKIIGETDNSLFTHFLVEGLEGEADLDGDGRITVDELYDYAYEKVKFATSKQTPSKFSSKQQGEIVLRQITRIEDVRPVSLPDGLIEATEDSRTFVREGAVQQLEKLLIGKNLGIARSAREALERIEKEDDSRRVSQAATQALEATRQAEGLAFQKIEEERLVTEKAEEERRTRKEAERLATLRAEEERLAREKAEAEREAVEREAIRLKAEREAEKLAARKKAERLAAQKADAKNINKQAILIWIISGTAIAGAVGGVFSWRISGVICGLAISLVLMNEQVLSTWQNLFWILLAWSFGGVIGWQIDFRMPIGGFFTGGLVSWTIGGLVTTVMLQKEHALSQEQSMVKITLGWALAGAIGWLLGGSIGEIIGWAIGWGIGGAIGGIIMVWNIRTFQIK